MQPLYKMTGFAAIVALAACSTIRESADNRVDSFVRSEMERQKVPGVAVVVVDKGGVVKVSGYGLANVEQGVPAGPATVFQSGSVGKQFTAVAVMLQVEDGRLALNDPVTKFFPEAPVAWQTITVRHLLTHTSGIPDYTDGRLDYRRDYSEDDLVRFALGLELEFPAGARWNYSNTGYVLLGVIVRKVSGRFYGDVLQERVFAPLGMKTARVISEEDIVPRRAAGYRLVQGELKNQEWVAPMLNTTADGALYLTALDVVAWDAGIRSGAVLKPESWAEVFQAVKLNSGRPYPYGFGWFIDDFGGKVRQHHSGSWQGFVASISRYAGDDLTIAAMCNLAECRVDRFVDGIAALYNPSLVPAALVPIPDPAPEISERLAALLAAAASGRLAPADFAHFRASFFPEAATKYREQLQDVGPLTRLEFFERRQVGDDWTYRYRAIYGTKAFGVRLGLTLDRKVSAFSVSPETEP